MELHELTATEARAALLHGDIGCAEYAAALLAQAEAKRDLNTLAAQDADALLAAAAAQDASGAARDPALALAGIPLALKDNINTTALPTAGGTVALRGRVPPRNAPLAQTLFDAGALLAGKANMHELAFGITNNNAVTGAVRNPWDRRMIPGGSSGGSAAAVAARIVPVAIGTDTGASVRLPAALCGVIGLRPTTGRYPGAGIVPISHTRDTPGPIARSVADIALLDRVLAGAAAGSAASTGSARAATLAGDTDPALASASGAASAGAIDLRGVRLGVPRQYFYAGADPEVLAVIEAALALLSRAGAVLVEAEVESLGALNEAVGFPIALYELTQDLPAYLRDCGYQLTLAEVAAQVGSPDVAAILGSQLGDQAVPVAAYQQALRTRVQLQAAYADYFGAHRLDAMVFPTAILPARPIGDDDMVELNGERVPTFLSYIRNTDPGSNAGIPGISLPAGLTAAGLPVGLELDAPAHTDRRLIALAAAIERLLPPLPAPPG